MAARSRPRILLSLLLAGLTASSFSQTPGRTPLVRPRNTALEGAALLPFVASTNDTSGARWVTTLSLANPHAFPLTVRLYLWPTGTDNRNYRASERVVTLPPEGGRRISDPLVTLWERSGAAAILLEASASDGNPASFSVESRLLNVANPEATYGLAFSGSFAAITARDSGYAADAESNVRYGTTIGLVNDSSEPATVLVELLRDNGSLLGSKSYTIPPYSPIQIALTEVTTEFFTRATVRVTPASALHGRLVGYVAVTDRATGDAAAHPLRPYPRASSRLGNSVTVELSRYRFSPGGPDRPPIVLRAEETYELTFRSVEGAHALSGIPQLGISGSPVIEPERDYVVTVTPGEEHRGARYNFACTVFCGVGHGSMYGAIEVE